MALTVFAEGPASLDPQKALYIPVGAASPLWFMFAGAASAGVAYWWMTRWTDRANLEALLAPSSAATLPAPAADSVPPEPLAAVAEASVVAGAMVEQALQVGADIAAATVDAFVPPHVEAEPESIVEPLPDPVVEAASDPAVKPRAKDRPAGDPPPEA
ncbi:MAG: hypothetical protein C0481_19410 [Phenylobacterium sp.]|uniref:hypothetical protein n=1 Tax=Phenylobacterium sp. TaxID=1871053 RepID=UPI0025DB3FB5|nr:hypothetical protein [Phenylobacterium sp.]MBA4014037.1 hypothetical protein [Phenylobacterium sp.]